MEATGLGDNSAFFAELNAAELCPQCQETLACRSDAFLASQFMRSGRLSWQTMDRLASSPLTSVRTALAGRRGLAPALQERLLVDRVDTVVEAMLASANVCASTAKRVMHECCVSYRTLMVEAAWKILKEPDKVCPCCGAVDCRENLVAEVRVAACKDPSPKVHKSLFRLGNRLDLLDADVSCLLDTFESTGTVPFDLGHLFAVPDLSVGSATRFIELAGGHLGGDYSIPWTTMSDGACEAIMRSARATHRLSLAERRHPLPEPALSLALQDRDSKIRQAAVAVEVMSPEQLLKAAENPSIYMRRKVASAANMPVEGFEKLARSKDNGIQRVLAANAAAPAHIRTAAALRSRR